MLNNIDCSFSNISVLLHSGHLRSFHVHFGFIITVDLLKNNIDDGKALKTKKQTEKRKKSLFSAMMLDVRLLAHYPLQAKNEQIQKTVVMT